jgi:hypothetical protein
VLYERSGEPVPDVQIVVPGAPHHRSLPTRADGYFVITGVPADTTELIAEWPGGDGRRFRVNADGADYAVIPRPVEEVETARTAIPPGSWRSAQSVSCQAPLAGFVLSTLIPPSPTAARTRVQVDLSDGASFVRAITHHPQGFALDPTANPQVHKRWEFTTASGVDPHIEVCLNSATGEPLAPAVLHASYWYVEIR